MISVLSWTKKNQNETRNRPNVSTPSSAQNSRISQWAHYWALCDEKSSKCGHIQSLLQRQLLKVMTGNCWISIYGVKAMSWQLGAKFKIRASISIHQLFSVSGIARELPTNVSIIIMKTSWSRMPSIILIEKALVSVNWSQMTEAPITKTRLCHQW